MVAKAILIISLILISINYCYYCNYHTIICIIFTSNYYYYLLSFLKTVITLVSVRIYYFYYCYYNTVIYVISKFFSIFAGFFSTIFGETSGAFLFGKLRRACPGPLRKLRPELSHIISAGRTHVPLPCPRSKTDLLTLEHGIAREPVNRATFQSAGPRAGILKLEDCTASVGSSQTNFNLCFCLGQCLATKTKRA